MKILGFLDGCPIIILIDSGSTHNFLNVGLPWELERPGDLQGDMSILAANGERTCCARICCMVPICLGGSILCGFTFNCTYRLQYVDLLLAVLIGFNVVLSMLAMDLGTQYLGFFIDEDDFF